MLVGECKSVLLPELVGFTDLALSPIEFRQVENDLLGLHFLKPWEVDVADLLVS